MKKTILTITLLMGALIGKSQECNYYKNEVDEFTGSTKIIMESESFISHTDSSLLKYYKKKKEQYLEIEIYTAKLNETYVLYFDAVFQTKKAYEYYGALSKGEKIMLKLSDGTMTNLIISKSDFGKTDYDRETTTYSSYCILGESELESLKSLDIDKIRIYWSKGYDDYDCDSPSVIGKQLSCLK
jgi:hypothetical protein